MQEKTRLLRECDRYSLGGSALGAVWLQFGAMSEQDVEFMRIAIAEAEKARDIDEVPIGACVVTSDGVVLAAASNRTITDSDPTAHAEVLALRAAARRIGNYRLTGATVYATIEPCAMCAGALVNARISRLVFGAHDERFGAVETKFRLCDSPDLNHRMLIESGVLADDCRALMQDFFRSRRESKAAELEITDAETLQS